LVRTRNVIRSGRRRSAIPPGTRPRRGPGTSGDGPDRRPSRWAGRASGPAARSRRKNITGSLVSGTERMFERAAWTRTPSQATFPGSRGTGLRQRVEVGEDWTERTHRNSTSGAAGTPGWMAVRHQQGRPRLLPRLLGFDRKRGQMVGYHPGRRDRYATGSPHPGRTHPRRPGEGETPTEATTSVRSSSVFKHTLPISVADGPLDPTS
jgi:hypothetical protein